MPEPRHRRFGPYHYKAIHNLALFKGPGVLYKRVGRLWLLRVFGVQLTYNGSACRIRLRPSNA